MNKVVVVGARGYTGAELLPLLHRHPGFEIVAVGSGSAAGEAVTGHVEHMEGCGLRFSDIQPADLASIGAFDAPEHVTRKRDVRRFLTDFVAHRVDLVVAGELGDVAVVDEHHHVSIVDRVKELIKYKGFQVPPAELEALLIAHPKIADVAVIGVADDEAGHGAHPDLRRSTAEHARRGRRGGRMAADPTGRPPAAA